MASSTTTRLTSFLEATCDKDSRQAAVWSSGWCSGLRRATWSSACSLGPLLLLLGVGGPPPPELPVSQAPARSLLFRQVVAFLCPFGQTAPIGIPGALRTLRPRPEFPNGRDGRAMPETSPKCPACGSSEVTAYDVRNTF